MTKPPLELVKGDQEAPEDDSDEVAIREPTDDELVEYETTAVPKAVDPPKVKLGMAELIGLDLPDRKMIVPLWARSWHNLKFVAWWLVRYTASVTTFHLVRLPKYAVRALVRLVVGAARTVARFWSWLWDLEGRQMARAAHALSDQGSWKTARREWNETVHRRLLGSACGAVVAVAVVVCAWVWAPPQITALAIVVVLGLLVHIGRPEDGGLTDDYLTTRPEQVWRMTSRIILDALAGLGIPALSTPIKDDPRGAVGFVDGISHDGPGWRVVLELPKGVTAADVIEKREKLAAGLRRPLGTVWPEAMKGAHPGRLLLYVGDEDMSTAKQPPWQLLKSGAVDLFRPAPFGVDQRMRPVWITLMFASVIIGAVPRMGKTFALRLLLLIAALDVRAKVYAFDKKGSGDLSPLEHVAHAYTVGDEPEDIAIDLREMRALRDEMRRRYKMLRSLPKDRVPESKVTPELASEPGLGLEPIVVGVDECQCWFEHKKHGDEFTEICTDVVKRGPAAGIMLVLATQRPDAKSIPKPISDNAILRFCLKVMEWGANDMVLGSGAYKSGVRATMFARHDLGIGWLAGEGEDAQVVRASYINTAQAEIIAKRARAMRERAGRLTGYATGQQLAPEQSYNLVDDLPTVFVTAERMHSDDILKALQELRPGTYEGWTSTTLAMACRDQLGLSTKQMKIAGVTLAGLRRADVVKAVEAELTTRELPAAPEEAEA